MHELDENLELYLFLSKAEIKNLCPGVENITDRFIDRPETASELWLI